MDRATFRPKELSGEIVQWIIQNFPQKRVNTQERPVWHETVIPLDVWKFLYVHLPTDIITRIVDNAYFQIDERGVSRYSLSWDQLFPAITSAFGLESAVFSERLKGSSGGVLALRIWALMYLCRSIHAHYHGVLTEEQACQFFSGNVSVGLIRFLLIERRIDENEGRWRAATFYRNNTSRLISRFSVDDLTATLEFLDTLLVAEPL